MAAPHSPVFPPWLKYFAIFAAANLVCAIAIVLIGHAVLGPMRPMKGWFIGGAGALALVAAVLVVGRYVWIRGRAIRTRT